MTEAVVRGIAMGSLYGLLAMAIALVHRTTGTLSFAHGEIGGFASLVAIAVRSTGAPWGVAASLALLVAAAIGAAFPLLVDRRPSGRQPISRTVGTVGLLLLLITAGQRIWGVYPRVLDAPFGARGVEVLGALVAPSQIVALLAGVGGAASLTAVLRHTPVGLATLATAHDRDEAALLGVPVRGITVGVWVLTSCIAAIAALCFGPVIGAIAPGTMTLFFLRSVVATAVGGTATMWGPVAGGLVTGVAEQVALEALLPYGIPGVDVLAVLAVLVVSVAVRGRSGVPSLRPAPYAA